MGEEMVKKVKNCCESQAVAWEKEQSALVDELEQAVEEIQSSPLRYFRTELDVRKQNLISQEESLIVRKYGWGIELDKASGSLTMLGYLRANVAVHLKFLKRRGQWYLAEAYYPEQEVWGKNFDKKLCFCKGNRVERMVM